MATKWPKVKITDDALEKLKSVPFRAWWAEEDEPLYSIPEGSGTIFPHHIALEYGLVEILEEPAAS